MDCSPPGSSVHGTLQARILEWIALFFSKITVDGGSSHDGGGGGLVTKSCPTLVTPWNVACQACLSMGFSSQEYWSGLPFPSPGGLLDSGIKPQSPTLQADSFCHLSHQGSPL